MDLADDVAYSVHDVEDGVVAERIDLSRLDRDGGLGGGARLVPPGASPTSDSQAALDRLRSVAGWPTTSYDGSRRQQAALKNLTSDLIGRFCSAAQTATFAASDGPFLRHAAAWSSRPTARVEMAVLKGIAAHYVMRDRRPGQRDGAAAHPARRALRAAGRDRAATTSTAGSPTTGRPPATTRRGAGWWWTRSPRSPTPAPSPGTPG